MSKTAGYCIAWTDFLWMFLCLYGGSRTISPLPVSIVQWCDLWLMPLLQTTPSFVYMLKEADGTEQCLFCLCPCGRYRELLDIESLLLKCMLCRLTLWCWCLYHIWISLNSIFCWCFIKVHKNILSGLNWLFENLFTRALEEIQQSDAETTDSY